MPTPVALISFLVIFANSFHVISQWLANPPNTVFTGIAHYYADYFLYVSLMAQRGWILTDHLFTNESLAPTWIYWLYTLLGKLGNPFAVYTVSIIVFSCILLWLLWHLVRKVFPDKPVSALVAFLFVSTASNFARSGDFWFSPTPALNRLGGVPHQVFQTILALLVIVLFHKLVSQTKQTKFQIREVCLLAGVSFLGATANPIQMLLIVIAAFGTSMWLMRGGTAMRVLATSLAALALPALIGAYVVNAEFSGQPILTAAKVWEDGQQISITIFQFLRALGPIGLLFPFGIMRYVKNLSPLRILIGIYGIVSTVIFLSPIPNLLSTTPVRWISPASFILFPILAVEGLTVLSQLLYRLSKKTISRTFWFTTMICLYITLTIPSIKNQINARSNAPSDLNHVPNQVVSELQNIKQIPDNKVVLVDPALSYDAIVPVFTLHKTFTGHPIHTLYPQEKESLRQKFFSGGMTEAKKRQFLSDHRIGFIITKPHAFPPQMNQKPLFANDFVAVYKVDY